MKVVLDTNVVLTIVSAKSPFRWIFDRFLEEDFVWCVTTDILAEYAEIIGNKMSESVANNFLQILEESENIEYVTKYFNWNLIHHDLDDNKFVDCAIACNATFIVTEDEHFKVLKNIPYPKVTVINVSAFEKVFDEFP